MIIILWFNPVTKERRRMLTLQVSLRKWQELFVSYLVKNKTQIAKFGLIGGSLYLLSSILLEIFKTELGLPNWKANLNQTLITYSLQFLLNGMFTWRDRNVNLLGNLIRIAKFIPVKIIVWGIHQFIFNGLLLIDLHHQIANALTVGIIMCANFVVFDKYIFTK